MPVDRHYAVPGAQPGELCRRFPVRKVVKSDLVIGRRDGNEIADIARADEQDHQHRERQEKMDERTRQSDAQAPPSWLVTVGACLVGRVHLLRIGHPDDLAVAA